MTMITTSVTPAGRRHFTVSPTFAPGSDRSSGVFQLIFPAATSAPSSPTMLKVCDLPSSYSTCTVAPQLA